MDLLADENVETEWIQALVDDGHYLIRVLDVDELGARARTRTCSGWHSSEIECF